MALLEFEIGIVVLYLAIDESLSFRLLASLIISGYAAFMLIPTFSARWVMLHRLCDRQTLLLSADAPMVYGAFIILILLLDIAGINIPYQLYSTILAFGAMISFSTFVFCITICYRYWKKKKKIVVEKFA